MRIMLAFPAALVVVLTMWSWSNSKGGFGARVRKLLILYAQVLGVLMVLLIYAVLIFGGDSLGETIAMLL